MKHYTDDQDNLSYEDTHLSLTPAKIEAVLRNPRCTYKDCEALYFSLVNGNDAGLFLKYSDRVLAKQAEIVTR